MRYFMATEFLEDGRTIDLISIGIVAEDGRELYAVNRQMPVARIRRHEWLMANVVPHLPTPPAEGYNPKLMDDWLFDHNSPLVKTHAEIRDEVQRFLLWRPDGLPEVGQPDASPVELWGWYSAYDHVVLAQLWGTMMQLPRGIPMWTNDLRQRVHERGNPEMPQQQSGVHDALEDARHVKRMFEHLEAWS